MNLSHDTKLIENKIILDEYFITLSFNIFHNTPVTHISIENCYKSYKKHPNLPSMVSSLHDIPDIYTNTKLTQICIRWCQLGYGNIEILSQYFKKI